MGVYLVGEDGGRGGQGHAAGEGEGARGGFDEGGAGAGVGSGWLGRISACLSLLVISVRRLRDAREMGVG